MNTAVISSYGYNGPTDGLQDVVPFPGPASRMVNKRRRLDSGGYEESGAWNLSQPQPSQQYGTSTYSSEAGGLEYAGASTAAAGAANDSTAGTSNLAENSTPNHQWNSSVVSPYPDVSSYSQQPYFFQQTDPKAYRAPWPPGDTPSFGTQANSYNTLPAPSTAMPFFPQQQTQNEASESTYNAADIQQQALPAYSHDMEPAQQYGYLGSNAPPKNDVPSAHIYEDASMQMKIQSLPILENLATQLIHTIAKASYPQIQETMRGNDDEDSQAYTTLKNLFDQTRKVYSRETPFIDAIAIQMFQPNQQEIIRKANISTFISSILGAHDVSFFHLNEFYMETFVPLGHRLLKWQGAIYLELKSQTYISALMNSDGSPEAMLDELFPSDLDAQILTRHPDAPSLSPSEQDFIDRSRARKSYLLTGELSEEAIRELQTKYQWQDFVREFASCISKNIDGIMNVPARAQPSFGGSAADKRAATATQALHDTLTRNDSNGTALTGVQSLSLSGQSGPSAGDVQSNPRDDGAKKASTAASTIRQPWTKPEEDALISGLDKVNGPHWSQILALYGRGGSISEVLKDRNQVQLKDKARNLKLWYLKTGKDVPPALKGVTGELRKRGGARARAALDAAEDDEREYGSTDIGGDAGGDGIDPSLEMSQSAKSASGSAKKKSKKGH
ncbi:TTAGGG repeat binding factor [Vermiconidia calcicola]|uniref:TTAGGG repeat binding factor n=1 Tax=Vermiconidia calcicola TaxID=1690605 RepID=A0ACC3NQJ2_9PEZI|nr:TTAGGG repeat binding factor [Vermiconidia calcicola]